ncbi:MAG: MotA/TolQ/ExbB proton channel family protein [Pseudomonadota bacterium]
MNRIVAAFALLAALLITDYSIPGIVAGADTLVKDALDTERNEATVRAKRLAQSQAELEDVRRRLATARASVNQSRLRAAELEVRLREGEATLRVDEERLESEIGNLRDTFATARRSATELSLELQRSTVSAEYPGRREWLDQFAASERVPTMETLEQLWNAIELEINEASRVTSFTAAVVAPDGTLGDQSVTRIGPFSAVADEQLLLFQPEQETLRSYPSRDLPTLTDALGLAPKAPPHAAMLTFDPTGGQLLRLRDLQLSWREQLQAGGPVGYTIIALGALGILIGLQRLLYLGWTRRQVRRQIRRLEKPSPRNPLGRVLASVTAPHRNGEDGIDVVLERAVLKESGRLVRGETLLKLLAAVAPLLGLLGTVTGMIITFQTLGTLGTSDPKLMAGGISQALVTTALGLIVAVPLLLMHAMVTSRSRELLRVLDDQSLGLLAEHTDGD